MKIFYVSIILNILICTIFYYLIKVFITNNSMEDRLFQLSNIDQLEEKKKNYITSIANKIESGIKKNNTSCYDKFTYHIKSFDKNLSYEIKKLNSSINGGINNNHHLSNDIYQNIIERLVVIDKAQKQLNSLSQNILSLQDILNNKQARGALGEIQLKKLISNVLSKKNYSYQYTLSNGSRADCIIFLPKPTGNIIIDSKFPLENFNVINNNKNSPSIRAKAVNLFRRDIKKHIKDISNKYILPPETSDGAIMFIPAESIFSYIHNDLPDIVQLSYNQKVWLASPSTMMAIITTVCSILKDHESKKHINVIQEHLKILSQDFKRFDDRMIRLTRHITKVQEDASLISTSAKKIYDRFKKIDSVNINP